MDNEQKAMPSVEISFNGKKYDITCNFGTLCRFQKATGQNPLDARIWANPTPVDICSLLWAALVVYEPTLTVDFVADHLTPAEIPQIGELFRALFRNSAAEETENPQEKKTATP